MQMEWMGIFEIPGSDVRVGGRLVITEEDSRLTTFGALAEKPDASSVANLFIDFDNSATVPMVWGVAEDGQRLTLLDLVSLGGNVSFPGDWTTRQEWICDAAIGAHIEPADPVTFSALSFGLTDLSSWLQSPQHNMDIKGEGPTAIDLSIPQHEETEVVVSELTLGFGTLAGVESGFDKLTVRYPARLTVTSALELSWQQYLDEVAAPMEVLLWVATGRFNALLDPRVRLDGPKPQSVPLWVSLLRPRRYEPPNRRLIPSEMLFTAEEMPGG